MYLDLEGNRNPRNDIFAKILILMSTVSQPLDHSENALFPKLNASLEKNISTIFWVLFGLLCLLSLLFFDPKVSIGGDDSEYLNRAFSFITKGKYPTFQGALYPMTMGLLIGITGLNLVIIKLASLAFMLVHFWLFFKVFKKHLPAIALIPLLIILSVNASMLYFASSAFTEAFFLMIQSIFVFTFDKYFISSKQEKHSLKDIKKFVLLGLVLFLMALTKNIGLTAIIGTCIFFGIRMNWMALVFTILSFGVFYGSNMIIKKAVFDVDAAQVSSQGSTLQLKHPYDPSKGKEDFSGYVTRVKNNTIDYISYHFMVIYGLNKELKLRNPLKLEGTSSFITILILAICIAGLILFYKENKLLFLIGIYTLASCGITFIVLQLYWSQERLILVYTPYILVYLISTIHLLISKYRPSLSWVYGIIIVIFMGASIVRTTKKLPEAIDSLSHYLGGDPLYGFTQDWIHYFEMSKWVKDNLPENAFVGARKPGMAFIYSGGKEFYGIWKVPSEDPEELYTKLKDAGVTHVMLASLRTDPSRNTGRTITTVRRYLTIIHNAYPDKLKFVHKVGEEEPVFLYELK